MCRARETRCTYSEGSEVSLDKEKRNTTPTMTNDDYDKRLLENSFFGVDLEAADAIPRSRDESDDEISTRGIEMLEDAEVVR